MTKTEDWMSPQKMKSSDQIVIDLMCRNIGQSNLQSLKFSLALLACHCNCHIMFEINQNLSHYKNAATAKKVTNKTSGLSGGELLQVNFMMCPCFGWRCVTKALKL